MPTISTNYSSKFYIFCFNIDTYLALQFMKQIKEKQAEKSGEAWERMNPNQRHELDGNIRQLGMMARYHNMMGNMTILTLEMITREIKTIFCHEVMVERIAAMLNYFLLHLVKYLSSVLCYVKNMIIFLFILHTCKLFHFKQEIPSFWCPVFKYFSWNKWYYDKIKKSPSFWVNSPTWTLHVHSMILLKTENFKGDKLCLGVSIYSIIRQGFYCFI